MALTDSTQTVPIAKLRPELEHADERYVSGVVTLIWPYASATKSLSLLLVEPDFRLRRHQGQVRVRFNGASAKAVARSGISSGDQLLLSLRGIQWEKDASVATTPGKGIEWEIRYGERVQLQVRDPYANALQMLIFTKIQRPSHDPITLDVDNPPPSPEPPEQTLTPQRSPPYNSHIATSIRKSQFGHLNGTQAWSSPAFLKRGHFLASSYDPFTEDEEFPDNDRRKKAKFGRGSGQWRFAGRTPSPEKEPEQISVDTSSPLRLNELDSIVVNATRSSETIDEETEPRAIEHMGGSEPLIDGQALHEETLANGEEPRSTEHGTEGSLEADIAGLENAQQGPSDEAELKGLPTSLENEAPIENKDAQHRSPSVSPEREGPTSLIEKMEEQHIARPTSGNEPVSVMRPAIPESAISIASSDDLSSSLNEDEDESEAAISIAASDNLSSSLIEMETDEGEDESEPAISTVSSGLSSSLDGDQYERSEVESLAELTEAAEYSRPGSDFGLDGASTSRVAGPSSNASPKRSDAELAAQNGSAAEPGVELREESMPPTERDHDGVQEIQATEQKALPQDFDEISIHQARPRPSSSMKTSSDGLESARSPKDSLAIAPNPLSDEREMHDDGESQMDADHEDESERSSVLGENTDLDLMGSSVKSVKEFSPATPREPEGKSVATIHDVSSEAGSSQPQSKSVAVEVIDLDDDDDDDDEEQPLPEPAQTGPASVHSGQKSDDVMGVNEQVVGISSDEQDVHPTAEPLERTPVEREAEIRAGAEEGPPQHESTSYSQIKDVDAPRETRTSLSAIEKGHVSEEIHFSPEQVAQPKVSDEVTTSIEVSFTELPSTVPDSVAVADKLMTPDTSQRTNLTSQPSIQSIQSAPDDDTLPTHRLTQGTSNSIVPPESPTIPESSPIMNKPTEIEQAAKEAPSVKEVSKDKTISAHLAQTPPKKRESALIEKLKALRSSSAWRQRNRRSDGSGAASTWFAPRRSSEVVPNSEAEASSLSENDHTSTAKHRHESADPDKSLAKTFIHSPSGTQTTLITPSSPPYAPQSQPKIGCFRTNISYYVPLAALPSHYGTLTDILAIAISSTPITKSPSGPRDFTKSIYITDPSSNPPSSPASSTTVQIFRLKKGAFPLISPGDAVLLRNFKVQSFNKRLSLLSTDTSAWAVFRKDTDVQVRGPPVEFGAEERAFARGLWNWWGSLTSSEREALEAAVPKDEKTRPTSKGIKGLGVELPGSQDGAQRSERSKGREKSLSVDTVGDEPVGRVLRPRHGRGKMSESPEKEGKVMHELRDGTSYFDGEGEDGAVETQNGLHQLRDGKAYRDRKG